MRMHLCSLVSKSFSANRRLLLLIKLLFFATNLSASLAQAQRIEDTVAEQEHDNIYILLDEISVYSCRGVKNEIKITEDDIEILNEDAKKVYYIKAPGNYTLNFKKINVLKSFGHLSGEIGLTLQVPILEGPAGIRFDVPYTIVPETGLLSQNCDHHSGIVERDKRQYCRYCELCSLSDKIENGLSNDNGHQFLPQLADGREEAFSPVCRKINASTYEFKRTISLPGRSDLERRIRQKFNAVDNEIRKRLNKGRGRFQAFLNLISSEQPPITQKAWFEGSEQCRCCAKENPGCRMVSFLYCNTEDCKSAWAQQCLHNSAKIVACYTVEFNYRITVKYSDVNDFLRENNFPNPDAQANESTSDSQTENSVKRYDVPSNEELKGDISTRCVARMQAKLLHLRRYCQIFWNEKLCCSHCEGVCR